MKQIVTDFKYKYESIENIWIELKDGTKLSARLFKPITDELVPAILEYIPYRKRDGTRTRDEPMHNFFAGNGYCVVRVDMRGCGESDGLLMDEYLKQEQDDALEVIEWIANQPWCNKNVGMMGKSWGGFNSLQVAARNPKHLKAIICVGFTDDRYNEDIHYKGGCLLNDNFWWGAIMLAYQSRGIDPEIKPNSKDEWINRLKNMPHFAYLWMQQNLRNEYWKHGSVCEEYKNIKVPVFAIDGWADSYTNTVFSLLQGLDENLPKKGIIGPWAHVYAHDGYPAPAMDFLTEAINWWDKWLKNKNIQDNSPMLQIYLEDGYLANQIRDVSNGNWVGIKNVHEVSEIATHTYKMHDESLEFIKQDNSNYKIIFSSNMPKKEKINNEIYLKSPEYHGIMCGEWMGAGVRGEAPLNQQKDNALSLCFDTKEFKDDVKILGYPVLKTSLRASEKCAMIYASICDIAPCGTSTRISYGVLNLSHMNNHSQIIDASKPQDIILRLDMCGYVVKKGHKLRLSLASTYWPMFWGMPKPFALFLDKDNIELDLPISKAFDIDGPSKIAKSAPLTKITLLEEGRIERNISYDVLKDEMTYITNGVGGVFGEGIYRFDDIDISVNHSLKKTLKINGSDPNSAIYEINQTMQNGRNGYDVKAIINTILKSDEQNFYLSGDFVAYFNDEEVFKKQYDYKLKRDGF